MIRNPERVRELTDREEWEFLGQSPFEDVLARYVALWNVARLIRPKLGADWIEDLEPDLAVARALNGLPPAV